MGDALPSSKKPRTQSKNASDANARATIARANNHVQQQFLRQNRWIEGLELAEEEVVPAPALALSGITNAGSGRHEQDRGLQQQGEQQLGNERRDIRPYTAGLVRYETPATVESSIMPSTHSMHTANSRSSMPSLPSPAPSDENTQSPTFAEGQLGQLGARRGYPAGIQRVRTPAEGVGSAAMHIPGTAASTSASASPLSAQSPTFSPQHHPQQFMQAGVHLPGTYFQPPQPPPGRQARQPSGQQIRLQGPMQTTQVCLLYHYIFLFTHRKRTSLRAELVATTKVVLSTGKAEVSAEKGLPQRTIPHT